MPGGCGEYRGVYARTSVYLRPAARSACASATIRWYMSKSERKSRATLPPGAPANLLGTARLVYAVCEALDADCSLAALVEMARRDPRFRAACRAAIERAASCPSWNRRIARPALRPGFLDQADGPPVAPQAAPTAPAALVFEPTQEALRAQNAALGLAYDDPELRAARIDAAAEVAAETAMAEVQAEVVRRLAELRR